MWWVRDTQSPPAQQHLDFKKQAAEHAVTFIKPGMVVGLGTGSTAIFATRRIAELLRQGVLRDILGFATSRATWEEAQRLGIPLAAQEMPRAIDLTIDGADEVDPALNVIKGGGGALLREKIVAQASRRVVITVDDSKLSPRLGTRHSVPVEVLAFGWRSQLRYLESLQAVVTVRNNPDGSQFATDSGNMIVDCDFGPIADPASLAESLSRRAGIVEHGLFLELVTDLIVAGPAGIQHRTRDPQGSQKGPL
jgi:ribose 5-phosphate isomerase A